MQDKHPQKIPGYEKKASNPEKECVKCNLFIPRGEQKVLKVGLVPIGRNK